ncbi:TAXI family TRAP transporter solute-binding subunit [Salinarimonas soli]|uniref:TAXI family TRAP transporter solute-binding subunit n=1 Tax=Salinarimonas soli TaxID=1638099 RepID=A0A5B2VTM7_9HYPH|nr:TAXI family TRAP transporter solute-binding subunit [Salinarimonas soli]KAA2242124.1 TAXI family TRAP transporter solute-binding subunit [Salinarimonas soli]
MRRTLIILLAALLAVAAASVGVYHWATLPTTLRIAVGPVGSEDTRLVVAAAQYLARERAATRLKIVLTEGLGASASAVDDGRADLAVVRSDVAMPARGQTVAVLHRNPALLITREGSSLTRVSDLRDRRIATTRSNPANERLLQAILDHYEIPRDAVALVPLGSSQEAAEALRDGRVDAIFAVGALTGRLLNEVVSAVSRATGTPPAFVPLPEAEAIAQRSPAYESFEVVRGAFGGTPPRPAEGFMTVSVAHLLVAHTETSDADVSEFTRLLFVMRPVLSGEVPLANRIEEPDTSKGSSLPVHPGAAGYYDGETLSFMERYGDWFYLVVMLAGLGGSAIAGLFGTAANRTRSRTMNLLKDLLAIVHDAREAQSEAALDGLDRAADEILVQALTRAGEGVLDETSLVAFQLGLDQARRAIAERRHWLEEHGTPLVRAAE